MSFTPFPVALLLTPCVIVVTVGYNGVSNYTVVQRLCQSASLHIWCPLHTHTQADQSCYGFKMHTDVQKHTYLPKCKHVALSINNTVHQEFKPVPLAKTSLLLDLLSLLLPPFTAHFQLLGYRLPRTAWANCVAMVIMPILSFPNSLLALLS